MGSFRELAAEYVRKTLSGGYAQLMYGAWTRTAKQTPRFYTKTCSKFFLNDTLSAMMIMLHIVALVLSMLY